MDIGWTIKLGKVKITQICQQSIKKILVFYFPRSHSLLGKKLAEEELIAEDYDPCYHHKSISKRIQ